MHLVLNLSTAWVVIKLVASAVLDRFWSRLLATAAWTLAAMNILGVLDEAVLVLGGIGFSIGTVRLTLLTAIKAAVILFLLLRIVKWMSGIIDQKLSEMPDLTPSTRLMLSKTINISLMVVVTLVALNSVGIDIPFPQRDVHLDLSSPIPVAAVAGSAVAGKKQDPGAG